MNKSNEANESFSIKSKQSTRPSLNISQSIGIHHSKRPDWLDLSTSNMDIFTPITFVLSPLFPPNPIDHYAREIYLRSSD